MYLWLKFISNITEAIENKSYGDYFIVKTDIKSFYENIPHDNLKRLLLGDGNSPIRDKIKTMREDSLTRYKKCLDAIFNLTEDILGCNKGMPQGPAYARYFAELYLAEVDIDFKRMIGDGEIILYQRYVDDIFFITKTKSDADRVLSELKNRFNLLNLEINNEKTVTSKISGFHSDFSRYRNQSKYSVDQVSRSFVVSSDKKKDMAINEFVKLIQSDSCQEDLSFIFSHLDGVEELNELKTDQVLPALESKIGRGSLFKNLFNFLLELNIGWEIIFEIKKYDTLQSEVLTSCLINAIEVNNEKRQELLILAEKIESHLSYSDIVSEHIAHLITNFDCKISIEKIDPKFFLSSITSISNCRNILINPELLSHLNISINELKSITIFVKVLYGFCFNENITKKEINNISALFYAKMSVEGSNGTFNESAVTNGAISDPITANKFYYLLCIFSTSNKNISTDLIQEMWKHCVYSFNTLEHVNVKFSPPNWLEKIKLTEINRDITNWIISSIVDGNIFRGSVDDKRIFERYHNALLVYLSFDDTNILKNDKITSYLDQLKTKSTFYNWLIDNEGVTIFPVTSKPWFEKNIIENGVSSLKKGNKVLLRKPRIAFFSTPTNSKEDNGFSEIIVEHENSKLVTFKQHTKDMGLNKKISLLLRILNEFKKHSNFPSIFCPEKVIKSSDSSFFSRDFCYHSKIITYNESENISSHVNTKDNFIKCFLVYISEYDEKANKLLNRYFNNIDKDVDKHTFLLKLNTLIESEEPRNFKTFEDDFFYYDVAISAALYLYYLDLDPLRRIEAFMSQYLKFYSNDSSNDKNKHIFAVEKEMKFDSSNPCLIISSIELSLQLIIEKSISSLPFYLSKDVKSYKESLADLIFNSELEKIGKHLENFQLSEVTASFTSRKVTINSQKIDFSDVKVLNPVTKEISIFDLKHLTLINSSEHTYSLLNDGTAYLLSINSFISKMYSIINNRYTLLITNGSLEYSYPKADSSTSRITSLNQFDDAVNVIRHHRAISEQEANSILVKWLTRIPTKFHQTIVTLIRSHEYMREDELDSFISKIKSLDVPGSNLFLIKNIADYNGTHRILYRDNEIGRDIPSFTPFSIMENCKEATLVTDLVLTGYQIREALKYYFKVTENSKYSNYFECSDSQREQLLERFKNIDSLNICTVLYTSNAIEKIQRTLRELLNNNITIKVISGRDIAGNAFFGTTDKISENEKKNIRLQLEDPASLSTLHDHLYFQGKQPEYDQIDKLNLVARFNSLPKKSFKFLKYGLKMNPECKPFNRVPEVSDK